MRQRHQFALITLNHSEYSTEEAEATEEPSFVSVFEKLDQPLEHLPRTIDNDSLNVKVRTEVSHICIADRDG